MKWSVRIRMTLGMLFCLSALIVQGQFQRDVDPTPRPQRKPAWEWTPAERAQSRRDAGERRERVAAFRGKQSVVSQAIDGVPRPADVIDGKRNPELFFVSELFEYLVRSSFVTLPTVYPQVVQQRSSDLFRNPAEWNQFTAIASDYAGVVRQELDAAKALDADRVRALQTDKCVAAARALREARRTFGRQRFDRMLYETVPVSLVTSFSADTDFDLSIGRALEREERCQ